MFKTFSSEQRYRCFGEHTFEVAETPGCLPAASLLCPHGWQHPNFAWVQPYVQAFQRPQRLGHFFNSFCWRWCFKNGIDGDVVNIWKKEASANQYFYSIIHLTNIYQGLTMCSHIMGPEDQEWIKPFSKLKEFIASEREKKTKSTCSPEEIYIKHIITLLSVV